MHMIIALKPSDPSDKLSCETKKISRNIFDTLAGRVDTMDRHSFTTVGAHLQLTSMVAPCDVRSVERQHAMHGEVLASNLGSLPG